MTRQKILCILLFWIHGGCWTVQAFSASPPPPPANGSTQPTDTKDESKGKDTPETPELSRRAILSEGPLLGVASAVLAGQALSTLVSGLSLSRPPAHEQRVSETIRRAFQAAVAARNSGGASTLRVLEVGIGADCRLLRRGLYNPGIQEVASKGVDNIEITGVDLVKPSDKTVQDAQLLLDQLRSQTGVKSTLNVKEGSITDQLPFADGSFDVVLCCLTLCSVMDPQIAAVQELKRLVNPKGGTFGYVEHVAVNPDEPYRWLEFQQTSLDGLQQLVADNCHLHRYTQETIHQVFSNDESKILQEDRFLVDKMWPVTSQCCGVIQRTA